MEMGSLADMDPVHMHSLSSYAKVQASAQPAITFAFRIPCLTHKQCFMSFSLALSDSLAYSLNLQVHSTNAHAECSVTSHVQGCSPCARAACSAPALSVQPGGNPLPSTPACSSRRAAHHADRRPVSSPSTVMHARSTPFQKFLTLFMLPGVRDCLLEACSLYIWRQLCRELNML